MTTLHFLVAIHYSTDDREHTRPIFVEVIDQNDTVIRQFNTISEAANFVAGLEWAINTYTDHKLIPTTYMDIMDV